MFSKMLIFCFCVVGLFIGLFAAIPAQYFLADETYSSTIGTQPDVVDKLDTANVTVFANTGKDNMTYPYSSLQDHPDAPQFDIGLGTDQYLEVAWNIYLGAFKFIELVHVKEATFLFWGYWERIDIMDLTGAKTGEYYSQFLNLLAIEQEYDSNTNGSAFTGSCSHGQTSIVFGFNSSKYSSISTAWGNNELSYYISYEVDWNATQISAWTILGELIRFQAPNLGIGGLVGTIFNYMIAIPLWVMTGICIVILVQSAIPFIKGLVSG